MLGAMSYVDAFIRLAPDCDLKQAIDPTAKPRAKADGKRTIAELEYVLLADAPYELTEADVHFAVHVARLGLSQEEFASQEKKLREEFFARPRACFRASPLPKKFGWGIHYDSQGRLAIYAVESDAYRRLASDPSLKQLAAMRSSRG